MKTKELHIDLPKTWEDLSQDQMLDICQILLLTGHSEAHLDMLAFRTLSGLEFIKTTVNYTFVKQDNCVHTIKNYQLAAAAAKLSWIREIPTRFTPLQAICGYEHLYPTLEGVPFKVFVSCENWYQAYLYTQDHYYLQVLTSALYSQARFEGYYPSGWDAGRVEQDAGRFDNASQPALFSVFLWYSSVKKLLSQQFEYFFQPVTRADQDEENTPPDMRGYINSMLRALTGGDITKQDQVLESDTWIALYELNEKAKEYEELKNRK